MRTVILIITTAPFSLLPQVTQPHPESSEYIYTVLSARAIRGSPTRSRCHHHLPGSSPDLKMCKKQFASRTIFTSPARPSEINQAATAGNYRHTR